jgi:hypothetical protein
LGKFVREVLKIFYAIPVFRRWVLLTGLFQIHFWMLRSGV